MKQSYMIAFHILTVIVLALTINGYKTVQPANEQWYLIDDSNREVNIGWKSMWDDYIKINDKYKNDVQVAVIDTGVDVNNTEIQETLLKTDESVEDTVGHGTKVVGIICASQYQGHVVGVADAKHVSVLPIKVMNLNKSGIKATCSTDDLIKAIEQAEKSGCSICNICLNTDVDSLRVKETMSKSNMLFIVSAGNGKTRGRNIDLEPSYPASYDLDNMIAVANIKSNGRLNKTSNYGDCVDISAPGTEIYNITLAGEYDAGSGSSYAAPIVTGLAAMLYICDEEMDARRCKYIIVHSAKHENRLNDSVKSNNIVQLDAAFNAVVNQ